MSDRITDDRERQDGTGAGEKNQERKVEVRKAETHTQTPELKARLQSGPERRTELPQASAQEQRILEDDIPLGNGSPTRFRRVGMLAADRRRERGVPSASDTVTSTVTVLGLEERRESAQGKVEMRMRRTLEGCTRGEPTSEIGSHQETEWREGQEAAQRQALNEGVPSGPRLQPGRRDESPPKGAAQMTSARWEESDECRENGAGRQERQRWHPAHQKAQTSVEDAAGQQPCDVDSWMDRDGQGMMAEGEWKTRAGQQTEWKDRVTQTTTTTTWW